MIGIRVYNQRLQSDSTINDCNQILQSMIGIRVYNQRLQSDSTINDCNQILQSMIGKVKQFRQYSKSLENGCITYYPTSHFNIINSNSTTTTTTTTTNHITLGTYIM